ncbi:MAG: hypothetical protein JW969_00400 [Spirochaetales bacterium]|nr:hypothetical protein [Spirochaetales bacterium]
MPVNGEPFHLYEQVLVKQFENGYCDQGREYLKAHPEGTGALVFDSAGRLYLFEPNSKTLAVLDGGFQYTRSIKPFPMGDMHKLAVMENGDFLCYYGDYSLTRISPAGLRLFSLSLKTHPLYRKIRGDEFMVIGNLVLFYLVDGSLAAFNNPGPDPLKNNEKLLFGEELSSFLPVDKNIHVESISPGFDFSGIPEDGLTALYDGDRLVTRDLLTFLAQSKEIRNIEDVKVIDSEMAVDLTFFVNKTRDASFIGIDQSGNAYFYSYNTFLIFNGTGELLDVFKIRNRRTTTFPAVSPAGEIFFLFHTSKMNELYKLAKKW